MIEKALPFLKKALPLGAAIKGIAAADPRLRAFLYAATAAGYGADVVMNFLREMGGQPEKKQLEARTQERAAKRLARPDELAALQQGQAGRQAQGLLKAGIGLAAGAAAAGRAGAPVAAAATAATGAAKAVSKLGFFQRAMEGISFFDLTDAIKPAVHKLDKRLGTLERQGAAYKDKPVQKIVRALRKLVKGQGTVNKESERFYNQYIAPQQQAQQQEVQQGQAPQAAAPPGAAPQAGAQQPEGASIDGAFDQLIEAFKQQFMS